MSVVFQTADEHYRALKSRYAHVLKLLLRSGEMTNREYELWRDECVIDATKFGEVKQLWDELEMTYPLTRAGIAEAKTATGDSPLAPPVVEFSREANALDELVLATLPNHVGISPASDLAKLCNCDVLAFAASFRRIRTRLTGFRAYECADAGALAVEVIKHETK